MSAEIIVSELKDKFKDATLRKLAISLFLSSSDKATVRSMLNEFLHSKPKKKRKKKGD